MELGIDRQPQCVARRKVICSPPTCGHRSPFYIEYNPPWRTFTHDEPNAFRSPGTNPYARHFSAASCGLSRHPEKEGERSRTCGETNFHGILFEVDCCTAPFTAVSCCRLAQGQSRCATFGAPCKTQASSLIDISIFPILAQRMADASVRKITRSGVSCRHALYKQIWKYKQ